MERQVHASTRTFSLAERILREFSRNWVSKCSCGEWEIWAAAAQSLIGRPSVRQRRLAYADKGDMQPPACCSGRGLNSVPDCWNPSAKVVKQLPVGKPRVGLFTCERGHFGPHKDQAPDATLECQ